MNPNLSLYLFIVFFVPICPQILLPYGGVPILQMRSLLALSYYLPTSQSTGALVIYLRKLEAQIQKAGEKSATYVIEGSEDALQHIAAETGYFDDPKKRNEEIKFTGSAAQANSTIHGLAEETLKKITETTSTAFTKIQNGKRAALKALQGKSPYQVHHRMNVLVRKLKADIESDGIRLLVALKHFAMNVDKLVKKFDETGGL